MYKSTAYKLLKDNESIKSSVKDILIILIIIIINKTQ